MIRFISVNFGKITISQMIIYDILIARARKKNKTGQSERFILVDHNFLLWKNLHRHSFPVHYEGEVQQQALD